MKIIIIVLILLLFSLNYDCWYDKYMLNKMYNTKFNLNYDEFKYYNSLINLTVTPHSSRKFISIFKNININKNDIILDIGCGNGYFLLHLNKIYNFKKLYGVEIDENTYNICKNNIILSKSNKIFIFKKDAIRFVIPKDVTIIYLFNPFETFNLFSSKDNEINFYKILIKNIKDSYFLNKRNITIFFMNIDKSIRKLFESEFDLIIDDSIFYQFQYVKYSIYRLAFNK